MNILYTLNDAFVPQVATSMCSIFENNKALDDITVYLVNTDITDENKTKLHAFAKSYRRSVEFIQIDDLKHYIDFDFDTNGWSSIVLARLLVDKLLPASVDRVLYLDGDTLVLDDLKELWEMDLSTKALAMGPEPTVDANRRKELELKERAYHNSGVILINLKRWRDRELGKQILQYYKSKDGKLFAPDQDAINGGAIDEIVTLEPRYNFFNIYTTYPYRTLKKLSREVEFVSKDVYNNNLKQPVIIHYLGEERPWRKGNTHHYRKEYLNYLHKTPWKDAPMEEGWELYFVCFRLFNIATKPFPMLRYKIINSLIPSFMKFRKRQLQKNQK